MYRVWLSTVDFILFIIEYYAFYIYLSLSHKIKTTFLNFIKKASALVCRRNEKIANQVGCGSEFCKVKIKKQIHSGYDWTKVYFYAGLFQLYFVYYSLSYYELNWENISDACIIIV